MIDKLYEASSAGVKVELIVRGICRLIPGVTNLSENITVNRLVGRYLEHARIFVFNNLGVKEVFMGSADWMGRNLYKRVEVVFPVYDEEAKEEILKLLELQLTDNVHSRLLDQSYTNVVVPSGDIPVEAQSDFYKWLKSREVESDD
jgi:polyphosphate kinase